MPVSFYRDGDYERLVPVPQSSESEPYRSHFRRDYARILHSPAFRRLQRKTQLFPGDESDFFRNRLTHSLEVAQIAKSIALRLNHQISQEKGPKAGQIDADLVELAGLAHDLGYPPFGHTGEHALHECMHEVGGFEGNAQTLRILSKLEKRQTMGSGTAPDFVEFASGIDQRAGLNLCYRSLAAILKYDNCIPVVGGTHLQKDTISPNKIWF
jgi:dGTPase